MYVVIFSFFPVKYCHFEFSRNDRIKKNFKAPVTITVAKFENIGLGRDGFDFFPCVFLPKSVFHVNKLSYISSLTEGENKFPNLSKGHFLSIKQERKRSKLTQKFVWYSCTVHTC